MYSPRVAYKEGRRIGRELSVTRIDDDQLRAVVTRQISPMISLRKSDEDRASEAASAGLTLSIVLAVSAVAAVVIVYLQPGGLSLSFLPPSMELPLLLGSTLLILIAVVMGFVAAHARRSADEANAAAHQVLLNEAFRGAFEVVSERRARSGLSVHRASSSSPSSRPLPTFDATLSPQQAEELAAQWMRSMGVADATVTRFIGDGGVDVDSRRFIAQVKHHTTPVGPAAVRELAGVASIDPQRRRPLFFSTSGYQPGAVEFADRTLVALFHMIPETGDLRARNDIAACLLREGLV